MIEVSDGEGHTWTAAASEYPAIVVELDHCKVLADTITIHEWKQSKAVKPRDGHLLSGFPVWVKKGTYPWVLHSPSTPT